MEHNKEEFDKEKKKFRKMVGINLNRELERVGYNNQAEAARVCGVSRQTINRLINGKASFDAWIFFRLGELGIKVQNLFIYSEKNEDVYSKQNMNNSLDEYPVDYILDNPNIIIEQMKHLTKREKIARLLRLISFCTEELSKLNYSK